MKGQNEGQVLAELRDTLVELEPESESICTQALGSARTIDVAIANTFGTLAGPDAQPNQRAWLSAVGSLLVETKQRIAGDDDGALPPAGPEEPGDTDNPGRVMDDACSPETRGEAGEEQALKVSDQGRPAERTAAEFDTRRKQQLKRALIQSLSTWGRAEDVFSERACLLSVQGALAEWELTSELSDTLEASSFRDALDGLEAKIAACSRDRQLRRQPQRCRNFRNFRSIVRQLADRWQDAHKSAGGKLEERGQLADQALLDRLAKLLKESATPALCSTPFLTRMKNADRLEVLIADRSKKKLDSPYR